MSWKLGAGAGAAGLAMFAWGLYVGGQRESIAARVVSWPRSDRLASYAVQLLRVGDHEPQPLARESVTCDGEPLVTDESGYLLFSTAAHHCQTEHGAVAVDAPPPPPGTASLGEPVRARTVGVALRGPEPEVFLDAPELTIGSEATAFVRMAPARAQNLALDPEPGLQARVVSYCEDGVVLGLEPSYHVTGLHLDFGPLTQRERLDVVTPVSRGGPRVLMTRSGDVHYAQISDGHGWLALFDANGLVDAIAAPDAPWPLPPVRTATLVATRGSFFDSAATRVRVGPGDTPCTRARTLTEPWPEPAPALELANELPAIRAARKLQTARGRRTAGLGLAGGALGLCAAILGARPTLARALAGLGITVVLFAVLALLLYA